MSFAFVFFTFVEFRHVHEHCLTYPALIKNIRIVWKEETMTFTWICSKQKMSNHLSLIENLWKYKKKSEIFHIRERIRIKYIHSTVRNHRNDGKVKLNPNVLFFGFSTHSLFSRKRFHRIWTKQLNRDAKLSVIHEKTNVKPYGSLHDIVEILCKRTFIVSQTVLWHSLYTFALKNTYTLTED